MSKLFWNALRMSLVFLPKSLPVSAEVAANFPNSLLGQIEPESLAPNAPSAQMTSVSQMSDVEPTDWAFLALQSLVERYGCVAGYPNNTYRGNRTLTRYEFAAGLNTCLERVNELIVAGTSDLVGKKDLATLQRLQAEFSRELTTLRGRVHSLEAHTSEMEANQFSTTTKLAGEAIFAASGVGGNSRAVPSGRARGSNGKIADNETFADRVRLAFNTSFTGKDLLRTRLRAGNITPFGTAVTGTNMTRLGFDLTEGNSTFLDQIFYRFPLGNQAIVQIDTANLALNERGFSTFSPFENIATGAISRYGRFSPIYRQGFGGAGVSLHVNPQGAVGFELGYLAPTANNPASGFGIAKGSYAAIGQLDFNAGKFFNLGITYAHTYDTPQRRTPQLFDSTGSILSNAPFGNVPTTGNHYGLEVSFRPSSKLIVFSWAGYTQAIAERAPRFSPTINGTTLTGNTGSKADIWYYAVGLAFPDLGKQGNLGGILFGQSPRLTANDGVREVAFGNRRRTDRNRNYHLETFYRYQLTDNIDITPGLLVIINPENNNKNDMEYVGTLRTTFRF